VYVCVVQPQLNDIRTHDYRTLCVSYKSQPQPDWVMWNCGLWPGCALQPQALMTASLKALKNPRPRNVLWKTTTVQYNGVTANQTAVTAEFRQLHSRVMPAERLTADLREAHEKVVYYTS
jgi:hypothetical protein